MGISTKSMLFAMGATNTSRVPINAIDGAHLVGSARMSGDLQGESLIPGLQAYADISLKPTATDFVANPTLKGPLL